MREDVDGEDEKHIHYHMKNRQPVEICSMTQGTQTSAL